MKSKEGVLRMGEGLRTGIVERKRGGVTGPGKERRKSEEYEIKEFQDRIPERAMAHEEMMTLFRESLGLSETSRTGFTGF